MSATKRNYQEIKDSPALSYISQMQTQNSDEYEHRDNEGNKADHGFQEGVNEISEMNEVAEVTQVTEVPEGIKSSEITEKVLEIPAETLDETLKKASEMKIPATPAGYRISPQYRELKTHRTQLVFPPSLFRKAKRRAQQLNISLNEFICLILQAIVGNDADPKK